MGRRREQKPYKISSYRKTRIPWLCHENGKDEIGERVLI
jgi:hypothetical protein